MAGLSFLGKLHVSLLLCTSLSVLHQACALLCLLSRALTRSSPMRRSNHSSRQPVNQHEPARLIHPGALLWEAEEQYGTERL